MPLFDVVLDHVCPLDSFGRQWLSGGTKLYFSQKSLSLPKGGNSQIDTKDQIHKDLKIKDLLSFW